MIILYNVFKDVQGHMQGKYSGLVSVHKVTLLDKVIQKRNYSRVCQNSDYLSV